ncbi:MAG: OB-fold domain-containing protein, partial [Acidimicrobiaceae bacterium]|nr:OB-fold domain-containing protein [Acidimicrobiaceae bacterium]
YWDAARDGRLIYQRCAGCDTIPALPSAICGVCGGRELPWQQSTGRGTLYSWTVVWRPQHPAFRVPYAPAVMAVEEGWWLLTSVVGCAPEDLEAGMPLEAVFHPAGPGLWLPYAEPGTTS